MSNHKRKLFNINHQCSDKQETFVHVDLNISDTTATRTENVKNRYGNTPGTDDDTTKAALAGKSTSYRTQLNNEPSNELGIKKERSTKDKVDCVKRSGNHRLHLRKCSRAKKEHSVWRSCILTNVSTSA